jgi:predicted phosphodiesterase
MARRMKQFRRPDLSLWQSAVDQVVGQSGASGPALSVDSTVPISRPSADQSMVAAANFVAETVNETGEAPQAAGTATEIAARGFVDTVKFCSTTAFKLAMAKLTGNAVEAARLERELDATMGPCDPRWAQVVAVYLAQRAKGAHIPYRRHQQLSDFVIDGRMGAKCRVALLADWGTGDDGAKLLLRQIAEKQPDVVIHLGDVYYSGTEHEFQNYFYKIWQDTLGIPRVNWGGRPNAVTKPATFTLSGNHDMYAGGAPYYTVLDMIGQPASYFCLRNEDWQFIALDTGIHDVNPVDQQPTFLEQTEVDWLKDKIAQAGKRKTILLSHHQLFSAFEKIGDQPVNAELKKQLGDILPQVTVWYWGHEHNLVIYDRFEDVTARCIGHGAFPVAVDELGQPHPGIGIRNIALAPESDGALFQHGYVIINLDGPNAQATYYQFDAKGQEEVVLFEESL